MDEQGIYCPQCRAYVHFWMLVDGRRPPQAGAPEPGVPIEMPDSCKQCGHKGTYKTTDLRTRRVPTMLTMPTPSSDVRRASTIDVQKALDDKKTSGPT